MISRRKSILKGGSALIGLYLGGSTEISLLAKEPYSDPEAADDWLQALIHAPGASHGALHLGRFRDRTYYLDREINWEPGEGQEGPEITVPAGFVTDLASIPRVFWSLLPTDGDYTFPAIVHDYMYWTQIHSRETADRVFRFGMSDMKVSTATAEAIYAAVRLGGGGAWADNARRRQEGELRLLQKFPEDPLTTWEEWRRQEGCCRAI